MQGKSMVPILLGIGLALFAGHALAANEIYRWVDEDGVVHFGNQPPTGIPATVVGEPAAAPPGGSAPSGPAQSAGAEADAEAGAEVDAEPELSYAEQRRQEREQRRRQYTEQQRKLEGQCEVMRRQRESVISRPNVLVTEGDGTTRRLGDEERLELLEKAEAFIADNCD